MEQRANFRAARCADPGGVDGLRLSAPQARARLVWRACPLLIALAAASVYVGACARRPPEVPPSPPSPVVEAQPTPQRRQFYATAYSVEGRTATGRTAKPGVVAADPKILPLGSRIRVSGAGQYSGVYTVADTGRAIKGHEIDIYVADHKAARRFGRRPVDVELVQSSGQRAE
jgi:3D (Asp-Asp-Asp) domain-containing protein